MSVTAKAEIVIVRRRGGEGDGGHHGGSWKIAYADFVTALMAFFLVMWLINASNEATRAQVASYFNPIKLTDASTGGKGLNEPKRDAKKKQTADSTSPGQAAADEKAAEDKLLADPVKTLDGIDAANPPQPAAAEPPAPDTAKTIGDPFDPMSWQALPEAAPKPAGVGPGEKPEARAMLPDGAAKADAGAGKIHTAKPDTVEPIPVPNPKPATELKTVEPEFRSPPLVPETKSPQAAPAPVPSGLAQEQSVREEILAKLDLPPDRLPVNIDIESTGEGLLISLTDKSDFGMFTIGSAEPDPKLIALVKVIAGVLNRRPGFIVVRGHTDSRPYRNKKYDNWQLSSARAQMAYYMLVRGGLDEARVRRIEGYADRDPKLPDRPDAAENRRIDILLGQDP